MSYPYKFPFFRQRNEDDEMISPYRRVLNEEPISVPESMDVPQTLNLPGMLGPYYSKMLEPTPELTAYIEHIKNTPKEQEYAPTKMGRLAAALGGLSEGWFGGAAKGFETAQRMIRSPYERALRRHEIEGRGLEQSAKISENIMERQASVLKNIEAAKLAGQKHQLDVDNTKSLIANRELTGKKIKIETERLINNMKLDGYEKLTVKETGHTVMKHPLTGHSIDLGKTDESIAEADLRGRKTFSFEEGIRQKNRVDLQEDAQRATSERQEDAQKHDINMEVSRQRNRIELTQARGRNTTASITQNKEAAKALRLSNPGKYGDNIFDEQKDGSLVLKDISEVREEDQQFWREMYDTLFKGIAAPSTPFRKEGSTTPRGRVIQ